VEGPQRRVASTPVGGTTIRWREHRPRPGCDLQTLGSLPGEGYSDLRDWDPGCLAVKENGW